jgi:hypothetical protein
MVNKLQIMIVYKVLLETIMKQPLEIHEKIYNPQGRVIDRGSSRKVENIKGIFVIIVKMGENALKHQSIELCNGVTHGGENEERE